MFIKFLIDLGNRVISFFYFFGGLANLATQTVESGGMLFLFVRSDRRRDRVAVFLGRFFEGFTGMTGVSQYV